jgi:hypothetical protein
MVEKIVDRKVRPVTLPGALLIWCLRFLFAEFLEARIVHLRNGAGPVEPALRRKNRCRLTLQSPEFVEGTPPSSIVKAIAFFENESSYMILAAR